MDFIAFNYYRTLCARHLEANDENPVGTRGEVRLIMIYMDISK